MALKNEKLASEIARIGIPAKIEDTLDSADEAWKANLKALRLIDHWNDAIKGERELKRLIAYLKMWIRDLGVLVNAADSVARRVSKAVHSGGNSDPLEEDDRGNVDNREGGPGVGGIQPKTQSVAGPRAGIG